jgi:ABC-type glycerol-3-phosphate transport system substrate-binding protein
MKRSTLSVLVTTVLLVGLPSPSVAAIAAYQAKQPPRIFNGNKTPQQGLDDAVAKGNEILKEFAALNK